MEQAVIEYLANALWQLPVLALGAWLLLRMWGPGPAARHRVWLAVLALGLLLPLRGAVGPATVLNGVTVRPASLTYGGGQVGSPQGTQNILGEESGSTATTQTASDSHPSLSHPTNKFVGPPAREGWGTHMFLAYLHRVSVSAAALNWIVGLWLAVALWGLARLAMAWRSARRLVADSREAALDNREREALRECAGRIGVDAPEVRESDALAGPVIVGAARPVLLWPEGFAEYSGDELRAALLHELAHVRRRDYGMNLLCEAAALPLKWHPVTHVVERQIRATREMACDAIAAEAMESEAVYAECLVRLARSIAGGGLAESAAVAGLFNGNVMEERVMRLMRGKSAMSMRARVARGAAGAAAMAAAITLAGAFHVAPAMAQDAPAPVAPSAVSATPQTPAPPAIAVPSTPAIAVPSAQIGTPPTPPPLSEADGAAPAAPPAPPVPATKPSVLAPKPPQSEHRSVVIMNGQERELTPAERARVEKQLAEAQEKIAEATAKINSQEFRKKIEDAQAKALKAQTMLNSAEFKKQMADAQKQIAEANAKMNSPEFKKKIQAEIDAAAKVNSAEFQKAISDSQAAALRAQTMMNSAEFQKRMADARKQIAEATARMNSPEFKRQIQEAVDASMKMNSAEFKRQMADAQKQIADAMAKMKAEQEKDAAKKGPGRKGPGTGVQEPGK
jgi:beta-lactamase regulating signal transducer with metallopeptidase domain